jgi:hypothetical protein
VSASAQFKGADRFAASLARARQRIDEMREGYAEASRIIAAGSSSTAPRRTGTLAASMRPQIGGNPKSTAVITSPLVYAGPVHWGSAHNTADPYVYRAAEQTQDQWGRALETDAQRICNEVQGV